VAADPDEHIRKRLNQMNLRIALRWQCQIFTQSLHDCQLLSTTLPDSRPEVICKNLEASLATNRSISGKIFRQEYL
jgi:hypothetical protein